MFKLITECIELNGLSSPWACGVCKCGLAKVAADVKKNTVRIGNMETKAEQLEADAMSQKSSIELLEIKLKALEDKVETASAQKEEKAAENSGDKVLEEISDRASRERNLVLHRCRESKEEGEQAKEDDRIGTQDLFDKLGLQDMKVTEVLLGWRRLGKKGDADRPLLLIFKTKADRERLLERAPRLARNPEQLYRDISIIPDLTPTQRRMEHDMFKEAERANLARTADQRSKNLASKVVGRRGERLIRIVELREDEELSEEGRVMRKGTAPWRKPNLAAAQVTVSSQRTSPPGGKNQSGASRAAEEGRGTKRGGSPGISPPRRRQTYSGETEGRSFGGSK